MLFAATIRHSLTFNLITDMAEVENDHDGSDESLTAITEKTLQLAEVMGHRAADMSALPHDSDTSSHLVRVVSHQLPISHFIPLFLHLLPASPPSPTSSIILHLSIPPPFTQLTSPSPIRSHSTSIIPHPYSLSPHTPFPGIPHHLLLFPSLSPPYSSYLTFPPQRDRIYMRDSPG